MDNSKLESVLYEIFGHENVKPYSKDFRVIVEYENMPYCVVLKSEDGRMILEKDAVDVEEPHYDEAFKKAYKLLIQNKDRLEEDISI